MYEKICVFEYTKALAIHSVVHRMYRRYISLFTQRFLKKSVTLIEQTKESQTPTH